MPSGFSSFAKQVPWLPLFALVFAGGIATYAILHGSDGGGTAAPPRFTAGPTMAPRTTEGPSVIITSPEDGSTVSNPVEVAMAIGGGLRYQGPSETPNLTNGHLFVLIDEPVPAGNTQLSANDSQIDLGITSHETTLPALPVGEHTITAVWVDADNYTNLDVISQTITVTVAPPAS